MSSDSSIVMANQACTIISTINELAEPDESYDKATTYCDCCVVYALDETIHNPFDAGTSVFVVTPFGHL